MAIEVIETDSVAKCNIASHKESAEEAFAKEQRESAIRVRAYQIYLDRGSRDGSAIDDWLQAEIEYSDHS